MPLEPASSSRGAAGLARPDRDLSRPLPAALSWMVLMAFVAAFAVATVVLGIPLWLPAAYLAMSVIAFAAYGLDKAASRRGARRVSERTLLTLGFAGGWPGALVAQQLFRHKTRKRSFRRAFWARVVVNVLLLLAIVIVTTLWGWDFGSGIQTLLAVL